MYVLLHSSEAITEMKKADEFKSSIKRFRCRICGKPFRSKTARAAHWNHCHSLARNADRNWNIAMMCFEGDLSTREIADFYNVSVSTVRNVLSNVTQYPYFYEIDVSVLERREEREHERKAISIHTRRAG